MLIDKAAERFGTDRSKLVAADGAIRESAGNRSVRYGELLQGQQLVKLIPEDPPLASPEQWKVAGTSVRKIDGRDFVTGGHKYTSDLTRPGMLYGKVLRPSGFHATLASLDTAEAQRTPDVTVVHDGDFVGVVARDSTTAARALSTIKAQWNTSQQISETGLYEFLRGKSSPLLLHRRAKKAEAALTCMRLVLSKAVWRRRTRKLRAHTPWLTSSMRHWNLAQRSPNGTVTS